MTEKQKKIAELKKQLLAPTVKKGAADTKQSLGVGLMAGPLAGG